MDVGIAQSEIVNIGAAIAGIDDLVARIAAVLRSATGPVVLTTSFGIEDQVLTHAALAAMAQTGVNIRLVTLDTGRLFPETHEVWAATERRYGIRVDCVAPEAADLATLLAGQGIGGYRDSVEARRACCHVRKVAPLRRAFAGASVWLTGLRADQSGTRGTTEFAAWDAAFGLVKVSPISDWNRERVLAYVAANAIPVNVLHAQGFLSIGCAPCTRAIAPGEPERAGRWWWEDEDRKECGLHNRPGRAFVPPAPVPTSSTPTAPVLETAK